MYLSTFEYVDQHSFQNMTYSEPGNLVIAGSKFAIARLSSYGYCASYDALVRFIEANGGEVKESAVKSVDYLIITPFPTGRHSFVYKKEQDKYEKAVGYYKSDRRPIIIRDVDFYIITNMFSKLAIHDKRRVAAEYINGNPYFTDKSAAQVRNFIIRKSRDDEYLKTKPAMMNLVAQEAKKTAKEDLPDEETGTLRQWRKYFSLTEGEYYGITGWILTKNKMLRPTVRVPAFIEGKPVLCIKRRAFTNTEGFVEEVILPDSVVAIEENAFEQCQGLQRIVIENPKCSMFTYSFIECRELTRVEVAGSNIAKGVQCLAGIYYTAIK